MEGKEKRSGPLLNPPNPNLPYREDCWSEGATSTLIEAWGERYVELNRGNLRQKHWQEVADAVNSRRTAVKRPPRTDVQCKNRIDTLKKKYKVEKTRMSQSLGAYRSPWQFFPRLDELVGPTGVTGAAGAPGQQGKKQQQQLVAYYSSPSPPPPPAALTLPYHRKHPAFHSHASAAAMADARRSKRPKLLLKDPLLRKGSYSAAAAAAAAAKAENDGEDGMDSESPRSSPERAAAGWGGGMMNGSNGGGGDGGDAADSDDGGVMELARAIERFGEVYEKVEMAKHRQMIDLERQRMEFARDIEFQRMDMFVNSLLQMQKAKRTNGLAGE